MMVKKSDEDRIKSLLDRIKNLERLLKKSRKSEKFWKRLHSEQISKNIDLSLALKFSSKTHLEELELFQNERHPKQKGKWE
tara:strand:+ start:156 stop:398 length:243 start_codon:yes stop_codon:yes gene_type:complete